MVKTAENVDTSPGRLRTVSRQGHRLNTPAADSPYIHYRQHIYQPLLSHLIRELKDMFTGKGSTNEMIV